MDMRHADLAGSGPTRAPGSRSLGSVSNHGEIVAQPRHRGVGVQCLHHGVGERTMRDDVLHGIAVNLDLVVIRGELEVSVDDVVKAKIPSMPDPSTSVSYGPRDGGKTMPCPACQRSSLARRQSTAV